MKVNVQCVTIDGEQHVEGTMVAKNQEMVYFVRTAFPDLVDLRPAVVARVLREMSDAVANGQISLENVL